MTREQIIPGLGLTASEFQNIENFQKSKNSAVLTIMFTDIQGFTALTEERGETYVHALRSEHDAIISECVERGGSGIVLKYIGDAVMAVFSEPTSAVERALEIQRKLRAFNEAHPEYEDLKVRIGLHMGQTVLENKMHVDLFGRHVNKASRIEGLASGGQVFISYPVFDSVKSWLIENAEMGYVNHGLYSLKGIQKPEEIFEVFNAGMTVPRAPKKGRARLDRPWLAIVAGALIGLVVFGIVYFGRTPRGIAPAAGMADSEPLAVKTATDSAAQVASEPAASSAEPAATPATKAAPATDLAPAPVPAPDVYFISLNALEPILDLEMPLALAKVEGSDNTKQSLLSIMPGKHLIHYAVSDMVFYFFEFEVKAGKNMIPAKFVRSELPNAQINLTLQKNEKNEDGRSVKSDYFYYRKGSLDKVAVSASLDLSVKASAASPEITRFEITYSLSLNGKVAAEDTLTVDSPMNVSESTRSEPIVLFKDQYHSYSLRYIVRNESIQVNADAGFVEFP